MIKRKYSVIYFLTWNCNMNCTYCYETNRKAQNMSWDVVRRGIDFFMGEYKKGSSYEFVG